MPMQETAMLIHLHQNVDRSDAGSQHLVQLIGFCADVPIVAVVLQYCSGGTLLQRYNVSCHQHLFGTQYRVIAGCNN